MYAHDRFPAQTKLCKVGHFNRSCDQTVRRRVVCLGLVENGNKGLFSPPPLPFLSVILECSAVHANSLQSCPTLCDPMDCSLPISSVHGILWARILKWVAMPSSRGSSQPRDQTHISYVSALAGGFFTNSTTCCCSVPQLCTAICDPMTAAYYTSLSFPSLGACSDSCLLSR